MSTVVAALVGPRMTVKEYAEACVDKDSPDDYLDSVPEERSRAAGKTSQPG